MIITKPLDHDPGIDLTGLTDCQLATLARLRGLVAACTSPQAPTYDHDNARLAEVWFEQQRRGVVSMGPWR